MLHNIHLRGSRVRINVCIDCHPVGKGEVLAGGAGWAPVVGLARGLRFKVLGIPSIVITVSQSAPHSSCFILSE